MSMRLTSKLLRWLIVTVVISSVAAGGVLAYKALTGQGTVEIMENLSWVGPNTFGLQLYPQESTVHNLTVANTSPLDIDIDVVYLISPDPTGKGFTVDIPKKITVPGSGQGDIAITVTASKSAEPGVYTITYDAER